MIQGTDNEVLGWQGPCLLAPELLEQRILQYDVAAFDLVGAAEALLGANDLGNLHTAPIRPPGETAPALRRGQIQARMGAQVSKAERKAARTHAWRFERTDEYRRFMETYRRFVLEFVQPQIYDGGVPPQRPKGFNHGRAAQSTMAPAALLSPKAQRPLCSSHTRPRAVPVRSAAPLPAQAHPARRDARLGAADQAALRRRLLPRRERDQLLGAAHEGVGLEHAVVRVGAGRARFRPLRGAPRRGGALLRCAANAAPRQQAPSTARYPS